MPLPSPFKNEPGFRHGQAARTGVLLCNLGTPDAPTAAAVRRYLAQFLSDPRVVEIPRIVWLPILHGIILRVRPARSALKYASIWTPEGSPLKVWTERQAQALGTELTAAGHDVLVRYAMTYGNPSIASELDALKAEGATRILIVPAYPQYSGTTTTPTTTRCGPPTTASRRRFCACAVRNPTCCWPRPPRPCATAARVRWWSPSPAAATRRP